MNNEVALIFIQKETFITLSGQILNVHKFFCKNKTKEGFSFLRHWQKQNCHFEIPVNMTKNRTETLEKKKFHDTVKKKKRRNHKMMFRTFINEFQEVQILYYVTHQFITYKMLTLMVFPICITHNTYHNTWNFVLNKTSFMPFYIYISVFFFCFFRWSDLYLTKWSTFEWKYFLCNLLMGKRIVILYNC
jgi:hypothetical protein